MSIIIELICDFFTHIAGDFLDDRQIPVYAKILLFLLIVAVIIAVAVVCC